MKKGNYFITKNVFSKIEFSKSVNTSRIVTKIQKKELENIWFNFKCFFFPGLPKKLTYEPPLLLSWSNIGLCLKRRGMKPLKSTSSQVQSHQEINQHFLAT